jgi:hypothetical protein
MSYAADGSMSGKRCFGRGFERAMGGAGDAPPAWASADWGPGKWGRGDRLFRRWYELAGMIVGFIVFWPIGLGLLFYFIWRKKEGRGMDGNFGWNKERAFEMFRGSSGNAAFDDYRNEMIRRLVEERRKLEEEQMAFRAFVERLRRAKDQEEFDRFMAERNGAAGNPA